MPDHPTHDRLRGLKRANIRGGMADAFTEPRARDGAADPSHAEWLGPPADREATSRGTGKLQGRMRSARPRHAGASIEDADCRTRRKLGKALFQQLATGGRIAEHRNPGSVSGAGSVDHWPMWRRRNPARPRSWSESPPG